jgi:hypothetical protein
VSWKRMVCALLRKQCAYCESHICKALMA